MDVSHDNGALEATLVPRRSGRSAGACAPTGSGGSATTSVHQESICSTVALRCNTSVSCKVRSTTLHEPLPSQWQPSGLDSWPQRHSRTDACGTGATTSHNLSAAWCEVHFISPPGTTVVESPI